MPASRPQSRIALILLVFACGFLAGFSWKGIWGPPSQALKNGLYELDGDGRLLRYAGHNPVACPPQRAGDVVLLAIGQSNAANALGERHRSRHPGQVLSFYAGHCYEAASPLIGASGIMGETWSEVGNLLIERGAPRVILMPMAISATEIARWRPDGRHGRQLLAALKTAPYRPTVVAWVQGESDVHLETPPAEYRAAFAALVASLRSAGVTAPIRVAVSTRCESGFVPPWRDDNPVAQTLRTLPNGKDILPGPDTDSAVPITDRMDACHLSGHGSEVAARLWADALSPAK